MSSIPNVQILVSKCVITKQLYGIRLEEKSKNKWKMNWAFPLSDHTVSAEKYSESTATGTFYFSKKWPGCPHCGNKSWFRCGTCGKIACWDKVSLMSITCPYCNITASMGSGAITQLKTGGDR